MDVDWNNQQIICIFNPYLFLLLVTHYISIFLQHRLPVDHQGWVHWAELGSRAILCEFVMQGSIYLKDKINISEDIYITEFNQILDSVILSVFKHYKNWGQVPGQALTLTKIFWGANSSKLEMSVLQKSM